METPPKSQKTYEVWGNEQTVTCSTTEGALQRQGAGELQPEARLLRVFRASSWNEAMTIHYRLMGWGDFNKEQLLPEDSNAVLQRDLKTGEETILLGDRDSSPDWFHNCIICGQTPVLPVTGMCGPCTFGEADTAGGNW